MRREMQVIIADEGRDKGRSYFIREMSATQAEEWAARFVLALGRNGVELPDGIKQAGFAGVGRVALTLLLRLPFDECKALMNEMFGCVSRIPDASKPDTTRKLVEDDIEEVATRIRLRKEVFLLHVGFSSTASPSI